MTSVLAMILLDLTPNAKAIKAKIHKWDHIQIKIFAQQRKLSTKSKGNHRVGKIFDKEPHKIYKEIHTIQ